MAKYRDTLAKDKRRAIEKAIRQLRKTNAAINISAVAARAGVARKTIYKHPDLVAVIDQHRGHPSSARYLIAQIPRRSMQMITNAKLAILIAVGPAILLPRQIRHRLQLRRDLNPHQHTPPPASTAQPPTPTPTPNKTDGVGVVPLRVDT